MDINLGNQSIVVDGLNSRYGAKCRDILLISERIRKLMHYFQSNKKDVRVARLIVQLVQKRKKLMKFWKSNKKFIDLLVQEGKEDILDIE